MGDELFQTHFFEIVAARKINLLIIAVINLIINYFLLMKGGMHRTIINKFENIGNKTDLPKNSLVYGYIFFSIFLFVIAVVFAVN